MRLRRILYALLSRALPKCGRRPLIFLIISPFPSGQTVSGSIALDVFNRFKPEQGLYFLAPILRLSRTN